MAPRVVQRRVKYAPPPAGPYVPITPATNGDRNGQHRVAPRGATPEDLFAETAIKMIERRKEITQVRGSGKTPTTKRNDVIPVKRRIHEQDRFDLDELAIEVMQDLITPGMRHAWTGHQDEEAVRERWRTFFTQLGHGASITNALAIGGISNWIFREWMRKGGDAAHNKGEDKTDIAEEPYRTFAITVRAFMALYNQSLAARIADHGDKDWKALAWLLARRDPESYGDPDAKKASVNVQASEGTQVLIYVPENGREVEGFAQKSLDDPNAVEAEFREVDQP